MPGLLVFTVLTGCGASAHAAFVIGPVSPVSDATFERLVETARTHGYSIGAQDVVHGSFAVRAQNEPAGATTPPEFVVQGYRSGTDGYRTGWFRVVPRGGGVQLDGERYRMPRVLHSEMVAFTMRLMEAVGLTGAERAAFDGLVCRSRWRS